MSKKKRRRGDSLVKTAWEHIAGGEGYDAREVMSELFDKYPERADEETTLIFAWSYEVEGRIYKAEDWTRSILEKHPGYMKAWELLAHLLSQMEERLDELQEVVNKILELDPNSTSAPRALASGYYNTENYAEAIRIYQDIVDRQPEDPLSWDHLAHTLNWAKRYEESLECWKRKLELKPDDFRATRWIESLEKQLKSK
jgi:tetratricopeptide (TPR) repeat protein